MQKEGLERNPWSFLARSCFPWTEHRKTTLIVHCPKNSTDIGRIVILLNKSGRFAPMKLRSDFREALTKMHHLHRESGKERLASIHFYQYQSRHSSSFSSCEDNTSKDPFSRWNMQEFGIQTEWTMTGQSRTTTSRRKELCSWYCVCVVKCSWRTKPLCWTLRRPTPMTTWKPRSRGTSTRSTTWTRECARSCYSIRSLVLTQSFFANIAWLKDVWVFVSFHPMVIAMHAWRERSLWFLWPLHHLHLLPLILHNPQAVLSTLQLHRG